MTVAALLAAVHAVGVRLTATPDGKLYAEPAGRLPPELREKVAAHKAELLAALRAPGLPPDPRACSGCGRGGFTCMVVTGRGDSLCPACWKDTTRVPEGYQPATPDLDAAIARADRAAEREKGR